MSRFNDPRLRRTLNQLGQNLESANEQAQVGIYTFSKTYIDPCLSGLVNCVRACVEPCFGSEEERRRRQRGKSRGRLEHSFDFYDDWDEDEQDLMGWGNDELEHLLAGQSGTLPGRERVMSYGTRKDRPRRKSTAQPHDSGQNPTILPQSSYFGFLDRLPWKFNKGVRYKPSASDLRENPGVMKSPTPEEEALIEGSDEEAATIRRKALKRTRSATGASGHTIDSLSSRGDIFPSEDELDDAVPIDDEFAMALERRATALGDESSSGKTRSHRGSRLSLRTTSSKSTRDLVRKVSNQDYQESSSREPPTLTELKAEEDALQKEEEESVEQKRRAAKRLAMQRGLSTSAVQGKLPTRQTSPPSQPATELSSNSPSITGAIPFPPFDPSRASGSTTPADIQNADVEPEAAESVRETTTPSQIDRIDSAQPAPKPDSQDASFVPAALPRFPRAPD